MKRIDKKKICVNETTYKVVFAERSYIEWYSLKAGIKIRHKIYAGINRGKTKNEIFALAVAYIEKIVAEESKESFLLKNLNDYKAIFRKKTFQGYTCILTIFIEYLKAKKLHEETITNEQANDYILSLINKGLSTARVKKYIITLGSFYKKVYNKNPFDTCIKIKVNSKTKQHFTLEQEKKIIECCANKGLHHIFFAIKLLHSCYIRQNEIRNLQVKHIDFENGTITADSVFSKNKKTQKAIIPNILLQEMQFLKSYPKEYYLIGINKIGSEKMIGGNYLNNKHREVLKELKIVGNYSFYSWKNTSLIKAIKNGIGLKDLQLQLRHHDLNTLDIYLKNITIFDSEILRDKMPTL